MGANIAGIYGAQIFREDDEPRYRRGFTVDIAIIAFGLALAIIRFVDDKRWQRREKLRRDGEEALDSQNEQDSEQNEAARNRGVLAEKSH